MPSPVKPVDPQRDALQRLFNSVAGADMEVDWMELKRILDHSLRDGKCILFVNTHCINKLLVKYVYVKLFSLGIYLKFINMFYIKYFIYFLKKCK